MSVLYPIIYSCLIISKEYSFYNTDFIYHVFNVFNVFYINSSDRFLRFVDGNLENLSSNLWSIIEFFAENFIVFLESRRVQIILSLNLFNGRQSIALRNCLITLSWELSVVS